MKSPINNHKRIVYLSLLFAMATAVAPVHAQTLGDKMVAWLTTMKGKRIGGGECAHVATESLRVAGASFILSGTSQDYVWSPTLVTRVDGSVNGAKYSMPGSAIRPGDVIQYTGARFSNGSIATHHTSVVATVNSLGRVTAVFEQNTGKLTPSGTQQIRYLQKRPLDLSTLVAGYVKVYRPAARKIQSGRYQFTVVNNAPAQAAFTLIYIAGSSSKNLTAANTAGSFTSLSYTITGVPLRIRAGSTTLNVADGAGYELFRTSTGALSVRKLAK